MSLYQHKTRARGITQTNSNPFVRVDTFYIWGLREKEDRAYCVVWGWGLNNLVSAA